MNLNLPLISWAQYKVYYVFMPCAHVTLMVNCFFICFAEYHRYMWCYAIWQIVPLSEWHHHYNVLVLLIIWCYQYLSGVTLIIYAIRYSTNWYYKPWKMLQTYGSWSINNLLMVASNYAYDPSKITFLTI